ncbi:hypothetical protein SFRURICE_000212 [Spodoptera frugiperda]|uniref:Uncharacterized protein LOC118270965 n=1 Tax=Spodoptera frugiperda TaxID=7108 RepID=A0A9R0EL16_SPOFR|nr:uncharacterized protein LOC118270965 [Spodoptera frugiperda]KAF9814485.1 hypothetical protein SFRURICE_000212 [Spodoptera frugiperda]
MDHYLTTYRKDYLWPNLPGTTEQLKAGGGGGGGGPGGGGAGGGLGGPGGLADLSKLSGQELAFYQACLQHSRPPDCRCPQYSGGEMPVLPPGKEGGWSRNEIMGPMLDPKLYPVRAGAAPETPTSRYDQPNAFLDKLQSKYPMLYSILQNEASPELKQRIDRDRNKTTYQVDYCETGPGAKFEGLQRAADESGTGPCAQPMRLPGDPCRVGPKPTRSAPKTISKQGSGGAASDVRGKCETTSATPPLGRTEYQDGVSKLGAIIMRDKLHRR